MLLITFPLYFKVFSLQKDFYFVLPKLVEVVKLLKSEDLFYLRVGDIL